MVNSNTAFLEALDTIKSKGFGFIKLELEAQLNRGYAENDCEDCHEGFNSCDNCGGDGVVDIEGEHEVECTQCGGEGQYDCNSCNGRGQSRDGASVEWCEDYILNHMGQKASKALVFGRFYDDGSVDSEYTFTMPIEQAELCLDVIEAFKQLNHEINGTPNPNIENAGMHLSILPSGKYPCQGGLLDPKFMNNFRKEVTKLLPALYLLATHDETTRGLTYRMPLVSNDDKYSAIYTHGDTCMEFRIFDTCYSKPEALLEKIQVVAATLKYYSDEKVQIKYKKFMFPNDDYVPLTDWFNTLDNYNALTQTLKHLKLKNKSLKALKNERKLYLTHKTLLAQLRSHMGVMRYSYEAYTQSIQRDYEENKRYFLVAILDAIRSNSPDTNTSIFLRLMPTSMPISKISERLKDRKWAMKFIDRHYKELGIYKPTLMTLRQYVQDQISSSGFTFEPAGAVLED